MLRPILRQMPTQIYSSLTQTSTSNLSLDPLLFPLSNASARGALFYPPLSPLRNASAGGELFYPLLSLIINASATGGFFYPPLSLLRNTSARGGLAYPPLSPLRNASARGGLFCLSRATSSGLATSISLSAYGSMFRLRLDVEGDDDAEPAPLRDCWEPEIPGTCILLKSIEGSPPRVSAELPKHKKRTTAVCTYEIENSQKRLKFLVL